LLKQLYYNKLLVNSTNKTKTTWNIINNNIKWNSSSNAISSIKVNGTVSNCNQIIAVTFNKYFTTVAQDILEANTIYKNVAFINNNPLNYLFSAFNQSFPSISLKFVSTKEIEDITNCLKSKDSHRYDKILIQI